MILERLKQYIDAKGITIAAFEREAGMSNAAFGKALKNNGAIGTDKLENILSAYPDINPVWLLTGNGNMLTSGNPAATAPDAGRSVSPTTVPAGYGNLTYRVIRVNDNRLLYEGTRDGALPDELQVETLETAAENSERSEETTADPAPSGRGDRRGAAQMHPGTRRSHGPDTSGGGFRRNGTGRTQRLA